MINTIEIKNFKSTSNLTLDLGRVNVFIGENGSGKSTILEALTFVGAAEADRLDEEFLELRGIRVASPKLMRSAFKSDNCEEPIEISVMAKFIAPEHAFNDSEITRHFTMSHDNQTFSEWSVEKQTDAKGLGSDKERTNFEGFLSVANLLYELKKMDGSEKIIENLLTKYDITAQWKKLLQDDNAIDRSILVYENKDAYLNFFNSMFDDLKKFAIYSPQIEQLKELNRESKLKPLGIYGEGLLTLLKEIYNEQEEAIEDIEEGLELIGWYESFSINEEPESPNEALIINDTYVKGINLELRNANEGFLYMLFYMALFVSKDTPKIFAIDNIDAALNPKLCTALIEQLVKLAKKYDKQVFLTGHNPAMLDGIDLNDDDERLFIVYRDDRSGETKVDRLEMKDKPKVRRVAKEGETIPLSEAVLRGYLPNAVSRNI
ncbi:AAA family ATPase [Vibrio fluvialis]|nr:AAA family ATPase [Vibrio fluvialis]